MITLITAVVGLASTIVAWVLNPKRKLYADLDFVYKELDRLYDARDKALAANDTGVLTVVTDLLIRVHNRKALLLQRLG